MPEVDASFTVVNNSDLALLFTSPPIIAGNRAEIALEIPDSLSPSWVAVCEIVDGPN